MTSSQSFSLKSAAGARRIIPAQLIKISRLPQPLRPHLPGQDQAPSLHRGHDSLRLQWPYVLLVKIVLV